MDPIRMIQIFMDFCAIDNNDNKEVGRLYAELLLCVCWHTEHI